MERYLTGDDLFAHVMMLRQVDPRLVIILEGPEDCAIVDPHIVDEVCQTLPGHGKLTTLSAGRKLAASGEREVVVFVDRDLADAEELSSYPSTIGCTEFYDLLADVIYWCPEIVMRIRASHADREKYRQHMGGSDAAVTELMTAISLPVAFLRHASLANSWGINLREFPARPLIEAHDSGDLVSTVCSIAHKRSDASRTPEELVVAVVETQRTFAAADQRALCSSHDLVAVLTALIRYRWAGSVTSASALARALRSAVDCSALGRLAVHAFVQAWADGLGRPVWSCAA